MRRRAIEIADGKPDCLGGSKLVAREPARVFELVRVELDVPRRRHRRSPRCKLVGRLLRSRGFGEDVKKLVEPAISDSWSFRDLRP